MPGLLETIAIGDELLTGKTSDTNTTFVADRLFSIGLRLNRATVILDDVAEIQATLKARAQQADAVFVFGGLGPTSDDKTVEAVASLLGCKLTRHEASERALRELFGKLGRPVTESALKQALYPASAVPIPNAVGLAPGFHCDLGKCRFYFLPGVPREMKGIFDDWVIWDVKRRLGAAELRSRSWRLLGIPESDLQTKMDPVEAALPKAAWLGYRTQSPENHLTLYAQASVPDATFADWGSRIRGILAEWCYGEGPASLEQTVLSALEKAGLVVATVESCTGGLAGQRLTRVSGASARVWGGVSVYQNAAKSALLAIEVAQPGDAVSAGVTRRLAESLLKVSGAGVAVAVTGSLGPEPANAVDPLGTVYLAVVGNGAPPHERKLQLPVRTREESQWAASSYALGALLKWMASRK